MKQITIGLYLPTGVIRDIHGTIVDEETAHDIEEAGDRVIRELEDVPKKAVLVYSTLSPFFIYEDVTDKGKVCTILDSIDQSFYHYVKETPEEILRKLSEAEDILLDKEFKHIESQIAIDFRKNILKNGTQDNPS